MVGIPRRAGRPGAAIGALAIVVALAGCGGGSDTATAPSAPFQPRATLEAVGGTQRTAKPRIVLTVAARPGDANIRDATVQLPPVVLVDANAIRRLCGHGELESNRCEGRQAIGSARVVSPAFDAPLTGPVYVVSGPGREFHLAYVLGGPAELLLEGKILSAAGRMKAGVEDVPDTALKSFQLTLAGGKSGYLILSRDICQGAPQATVEFTSQEGASRTEEIPFQADCSGA